MKQALFISKNLIGDGLQTSRALNQWYRLNLDYEIVLRTDLNHVTPIYEHMGVPLTVVTSDDLQDFDFTHTFDPSKAFAVCDRRYQEWRLAHRGMPHPGYIRGAHIADAYAELLGIELPQLPNAEHVLPIFKPIVYAPGGQHARDRELIDESEGKVLVSMFSASCTSRDKNHPGLPPNKMLPWVKWPPILEYLESEFGEGSLRFLGAPEDRAVGLRISEDEYWTGIPLNTLAQMMKRAELVVTLDNGMAHLAASQKAKEVVLYPQCLGIHYIVPYGNPNLGVTQIDPVTVAPESIIKALRMFVNDFKGSEEIV